MAETKSLVAKLAEVMATVERIPKRGRNDFHKYDYATEADIVATVRQELASRRVMLIPEVRSVTREPVGEKGSVLTTLAMRFIFRDGDSNEQIEREWVGCGSDKDDKGIYKAMTGGEKYFLLKTFLMPTGDDPEREEQATQKARDKATVKLTAAERKSRPPAPEGTVYIDKVVPRSKGNVEWADIITSAGEELVAHVPALISLAHNVAQENVPVILTAHVNQKGRTDLDGIERWGTRSGVAPSTNGAAVAQEQVL